MQIKLDELGSRPFDRYHAKGYMKFQCGNKAITLEEAASKAGMTLADLGHFNFGQDPDYKACFKAWRDAMWEEKLHNGALALVGWLGSWVWVPGDRALPQGADPNEGEFKGPPKREESPSKKRAGELAATFEPRPEKFFAARSQTDGVWAVATVDCGIEAGDILFSHHAPDDFISKMTMSWMTHAGIALNAEQAVDADNREEGEAVAPISLEKFFKQGKPPHYDQSHVTPSGGLVYRYKGKPGDSPKAAEDVRYKAAIWAQAQINNKWKFSLEHSPIIDVKKKKGKIVKIYHDRDSDKKIRIVEKSFDSGGEAVDAKGRRLQYWSRSEGKYMDTPFQTIYCAELVWRAYRAAGVNIVDPKKFFNLYEDDNRAIAGCLWFKIEGEREAQDFEQDNDGPYAYSQTAQQIGEGFSGATGKLAKALPNSVLRKKVLGYMKAKNSGFLCAPYQLAQSPLCKRFAQLPPVDDDDFKEIELADFHGANLNPLEVVKVLCAGDDEDAYLKAWADFAKKKAKKVKVSVQKPWPDCTDKEAPKLVTTSKEYNKPVDFSAASQKPPFMT